MNSFTSNPDQIANQMNTLTDSIPPYKYELVWQDNRGWANNNNGVIPRHSLICVGEQETVKQWKRIEREFDTKCDVNCWSDSCYLDEETKRANIFYEECMRDSGILSYPKLEDTKCKEYEV